MRRRQRSNPLAWVSSPSLPRFGCTPIPFPSQHPELRDTAQSMSQENVELAYRLADAFNHRDLGTYLALTDEDVEWLYGEILRAGDSHAYRSTAVQS